MRIFTIIITLMLLGSCANIERDFAEDVAVSHQVKLNRCEVEGFAYPGISAGLEAETPLKVLMVHGVGIHHPGYSRRIQENIATATGLNVLSRLPKNILLRDPASPKTPIGNLRITNWQSADGRKRMLFYELTWSEITTPDKQIIAFDTTEQYSKFRVPFNNTMKTFLDNTLPDPLIYEIDKNNLILNSNLQALCWMLSANWDNIPNNQARVCSFPKSEQIKAFDRTNLLFITHSLGSQILYNTLIQTANEVSDMSKIDMAKPELKAAINRLQNKELTIIMLANQLPILQIGRSLPRVHSQINAYCSKGGSQYNHRVFKGVNIVAISDPNDILSYAIPQEFADKYIDSRICPLVTNVSVNVAPEISAFGVGIVNPIAAHTNYDNSPKVIDLITRGTTDFRQDVVLNRLCHFIELKKDQNMK